MIDQATIDELRHYNRISKNAGFTSVRMNVDVADALLDAAERALRLEAVLRKMRDYGMLDDMVQHEIDAALKEQP